MSNQAPEREITVPLSVADLIDRVFLPRNINKLRTATPEVIDAAKTFRHVVKGHLTSKTPTVTETLRSQRDTALKILERALLNEGQDGCCLPVLKHCSCWRCQARRAIQGGAS